MAVPKKNSTWNILSQTMIILGGGLTTVALYCLIYLGIYLSLEAAFYPNNPTEFPATPLRTTLAVILFVLHVVIRFTKTKDIMKAALGVPPVGIMVIAIVLRFYDRIFLFLIIIGIFSAAAFAFLIMRKAKWMYYLSLTYGLTLGLIYARPQA